MTLQPDIPHSRQHIRQQIRERRRALSPEQQRLFAQQAAERMMAWPPVVLAHTVALFLSFDGELDTQPLIDQLWRGFYDRTLQNWQQYRLQPVGYAHDCQQVDSLPSEEWDIPLPAVITPGKTWSW